MEKVPLLDRNSYASHENGASDSDHESTGSMDIKTEIETVFSKSKCDEKSTTENDSPNIRRSSSSSKYNQANQDLSHENCRNEMKEVSLSFEHSKDETEKLYDVDFDTQRIDEHFQRNLNSTRLKGQNSPRYKNNKELNASLDNFGTRYSSSTQVKVCKDRTPNHLIRRRDVEAWLYGTNKICDTALEVDQLPEEYSPSTDDENGTILSPAYKSSTRFYSINRGGVSIEDDSVLKNQNSGTKESSNRYNNINSSSLHQYKDQSITLIPFQNKSKKNSKRIVNHHSRFKHGKDTKNAELDTLPGIFCSCCYYVTSCFKTKRKETGEKKASKASCFIEKSKSSKEITLATNCKKYNNKLLSYNSDPNTVRTNVFQEHKNSNTHLIKKEHKTLVDYVEARGTSDILNTKKQSVEFYLGSEFENKMFNETYSCSPRNLKEIGKGVKCSGESETDAINNMPVKKKETKPLVDCVEYKEISKIDTKKLLAQFNSGREMSSNLYGDIKTDIFLKEQNNGTNTELEDVDTKKAKCIAEIPKPDNSKSLHENKIDTKSILIDFNSGNNMVNTIYGRVNKFDVPETKTNSDKTLIVPACVQQKDSHSSCPLNVCTKDSGMKFMNHNILLGDVMANGDNTNLNCEKHPNEYSRLSCRNPNLYGTTTTIVVPLNIKVEKHCGLNDLHGNVLKTESRLHQVEKSPILNRDNSSGRLDTAKYMNDTINTKSSLIDFNSAEAVCGGFAELQDGRSLIKWADVSFANENSIFKDQRRHLHDSRSICQDSNFGNKMSDTIYGRFDNFEAQVVKLQSHQTQTTSMYQNNLYNNEPMSSCGINNLDNCNNKIMGLNVAQVDTTTNPDCSNIIDDCATKRAKVNKEKLLAGTAMADVMGGSLFCTERT